jgi:hypothetical protein
MEKNAEFEKLNYGFKEAYENLVDGHQSIAKFADDLHAVGFSRNWTMNIEEKVAAQTGIFRTLGDIMCTKDEMKRISRDLLDVVIEDYNDYIY